MSKLDSIENIKRMINLIHLIHKIHSLAYSVQHYIGLALQIPQCSFVPFPSNNIFLRINWNEGCWSSSSSQPFDLFYLDICKWPPALSVTSVSPRRRDRALFAHLRHVHTSTGAHDMMTSPSCLTSIMIVSLKISKVFTLSYCTILMKFCSCIMLHVRLCSRLLYSSWSEGKA